MLFKNPIAPKSRKADKNFAAPTKEQATTGRFMPAGDSYGTGFRQKVGTERPSKGLHVPQKSKRKDYP